VLLCVEKDETAWQELLTQYSLFTDGIHNYRIDENSSLLKHYGVKEIPSYSIVAQNGDIFDLSAAHPNDPQLEKDFKFLIDQASEQ
jgi:hypothetical protein